MIECTPEGAGDLRCQPIVVSTRVGFLIGWIGKRVLNGFDAGVGQRRGERAVDDEVAVCAEGRQLFVGEFHGKPREPQINTDGGARPMIRALFGDGLRSCPKDKNLVSGDDRLRWTYQDCFVIWPLLHDHLVRSGKAATTDDVDDEHRADGGGGDEHQHHDDLVFDGDDGIGTSQDLTGHHTGDGYESDGHHRIDRGNHSGFNGVAEDAGGGFLIGRTERQAEFDPVPLTA